MQNPPSPLENIPVEAGWIAQECEFSALPYNSLFNLDVCFFNVNHFNKTTLNFKKFNKNKNSYEYRK